VKELSGTDEPFGQATAADFLIWERKVRGDLPEKANKV
jgi:hypothetical protein